MKTFKEYLITEGKNPTWVKIIVGGMVLQLRSLSSQINQETDPMKQSVLLSKQNNLLGYMIGLGIGFSAGDKRLQNRMRTLGRRKS